MTEKRLRKASFISFCHFIYMHKYMCVYKYPHTHTHTYIYIYIYIYISCYIYIYIYSIKKINGNKEVYQKKGLTMAKQEYNPEI